MPLRDRIDALLLALNHPSLPGVELSLGRMQALLTALGNPEEKLPPVIHLAGTNGKGSTLAFLKAIYQAAGYRVHAYTSPHLRRFNERIVLGGEEISNAALLPLLERVYACMPQTPATFFEATTAAALLGFSESAADVVLLETGLGGRCDATNVVATPLMTLLTPISFDHMDFLGGDLATIAGEKAAIMKPGAICISARQEPAAQQVISAVSQRLSVPLLLQGEAWYYRSVGADIEVVLGDLCWRLPSPSLVGAHQAQNAALASVAVRSCPALPVHEDALKEGVAQACWLGRLQQLHRGALVDAWGARGAVILDGAHNVAGAEALATWMAAQEKPITLLCGMMARKDAGAFLQGLAPHVRHLFTVPIAGEPCYSPEALADAGRAAGMAQVTALSGLESAMAVLGAEPDGILLIAGSLFLVGEVLQNHG